MSEMPLPTPNPVRLNESAWNGVLQARDPHAQGIPDWLRLFWNMLPQRDPNDGRAGIDIALDAIMQGLQSGGNALMSGVNDLRQGAASAMEGQPQFDPETPVYKGMTRNSDEVWDLDYDTGFPAEIAGVPMKKNVADLLNSTTVPKNVMPVPVPVPVPVKKPAAPVKAKKAKPVTAEVPMWDTIISGLGG